MRAILALLLALVVSGCGLLYKQSVQQGNLLETDQVDALKPGMTKRQVMLVLGTPALQSPFHDDRWDYVSSYKDGEGEIDLKRLTVVFDDNVLVRIEGDYEPGKGVHAKGSDPESPVGDEDEDQG
ncbi:MAG: outer membrane protein assembly factor BamE [Xanthomonadales bacterium]|nr:Outer membrane protein assembly factor BamE [Xanthomonadales bacterium]MCC6594736.1 outer membrane protein assembly factor BamE [Xanthomonadales bacterium]MCE7932136.1 outer membrane protein assembly factor BamE [Xanthomonadales bacterium PRO6]